MKTKFKYSELRKASKLNARLNYFNKWKRSHPFETMSAVTLAAKLLHGNFNFTMEGELINE